MSDLVLGAITIKATDIQDNDKLIRFLTPKGILTAKARGVKKADAKLKFCAQPFCFCEVTLAERGGYYTLTGASLYDTFFDLTRDYDMFCIATSMLETSELLDPSVAGRGMIELVNAFKSLLQGRIRETFVKFLLNMMEIIGYKYMTDCCAKCSFQPSKRVFFDYEAGCVCSTCVGYNTREISVGAFNALRLIGEADYNLIANYKLNENALNEAINILLSAIKFKTELEVKAFGLLSDY